MADAEIVAGFNRQRRSLLVASLVLTAFQGLTATINEISIFGNTVHLSAPLAVSTPLWIAWGYFLVRYYQYLRDLGDKGVRARYRDRLVNLAYVVAARSAHRYLGVGRAGLPPRTQLRTVVKEMYLTSSTPPPWEYEFTGAVEIDERPPGTGGRMLTFERTHFQLPWRPLLVPHFRAAWWVLVHTRLMTEYALPVVVAAIPPALALRDWLGTTSVTG